MATRLEIGDSVILLKPSVSDLKKYKDYGVGWLEVMTRYINRFGVIKEIDDISNRKSGGRVVEYLVDFADRTSFWVIEENLVKIETTDIDTESLPHFKNLIKL
jgi:hypothetical protein